MGIPALDRGLDLIETLIIKNRPLSYTELKFSISGISDSSLNRLLSSLIEKGFLVKELDGKYNKGEKLHKWKNIFNIQKNLLKKLEQIIDNVVDNTNESAAIGVLENDRINIIASKSAENSISIIKPNNTLFFEQDHAGALAILETLSQEERLEFLKSKYSQIKSNNQYMESIKQFQCFEQNTKYFLDESTSRIGVSRMAIAMHLEEKVFTLFICAPTTRLLEKKDEFISILKEYTI